MAISRKFLLSRVATLNIALDRPVEQFSSGTGEPTRFSVGHIHLDHNRNGYSLEEQTSEQGAVSVLTHRQSAKEINCTIDGMIKGIGLRNRHLGELMLRHELVQKGLTTADAPLYNN
jgi:hypothetical protein